MGKGEKADDRWTVLLCGVHHTLQHDVGERQFWRYPFAIGVSINPIFLALALYAVTGDHEAGEDIIRAHHEALTP